MFSIGTRVRAKDDVKVGPRYRGLVGTIVERDGSKYYVNFDYPPRRFPQEIEREVSYRGGQGGTWNEDNLEPVDSLCADCDGRFQGENDYLCSKCRNLGTIV